MMTIFPALSISIRAMCTPAAVTALTALVTSCCRNVEGARATKAVLVVGEQAVGRLGHCNLLLPRRRSRNQRSQRCAIAVQDHRRRRTYPFRYPTRPSPAVFGGRTALAWAGPGTCAR